MRSDIVNIDNSGLGFRYAIEQVKKVAAYKELDEGEAVTLQILTEEMLSLARSITGELDASFWIETEGARADLHMTTKAVLDKEKRAELIASSTSRKNESAKTFLGRLRDRFEEAMTAEASHFDPAADLLSDLPGGVGDTPEWDGYERSILKQLADDIKIGIRKDIVEITVSKNLDAQE